MTCQRDYHHLVSCLKHLPWASHRESLIWVNQWVSDLKTLPYQTRAVLVLIKQTSHHRRTIGVERGCDEGVVLRGLPWVTWLRPPAGKATYRTGDETWRGQRGSNSVLYKVVNLSTWNKHIFLHGMCLDHSSHVVFKIY